MTGVEHKQVQQTCESRGGGGLAFAVLLCLAVGVVVAVRRKNGEAPPQQRAEVRDTTVHVEGTGAGGGSLSVASVPAGASLMVNGRLVGATPVRLDGLPTGNYVVRLEKYGCRPVSRCVEIGAAGLSLDETLEAVQTGALAVDVKPRGAEVLLDGELLGNTPLKASDIPVGPHELLVRKTNFDPYSAQITVRPGEMLPFGDFELKDKILGMLEGQVKSEPQRLAHYIDLGHYLFVNDRMDEAVEVYAQGLQVMQRPLDLNGPGFNGRDKMSEDEIALEQRLRNEDASRFLKELDKHRNWPRKDTNAFRNKLEQAQQLLSQKNVASWTWIETAARMHLRSRNFDKAIQLYKDHIAAAPQSPSVAQAYTALIEANLMQRDLAQAREAFDKFRALFQDNEPALRVCGETIYPYHDRMSPKGKVQVLDMAELALRRALELAKEPVARAQCLFDVGTVVNYQGRPKEAITLFQESIAATRDVEAKEERYLRLADALRKAERIPEAEVLYEKLKKSARASIRESANTGLIYVAADKARIEARKPEKRR